MKKTISKHKTTITGLITAALCIGGLIRWMAGMIDTMELAAYIGLVNTIAITVVSAFAKDGNIKKNEDNS